MSPNENQIIEQVKQGNADAFRIIVDRYRDNVYGLVLRMLSNREEAEELAQDAFIKAFNALRNYRGDSKFSTWLYSITYNTCISHLRKHKLEMVEINDTHICSDYNSGYKTLVKKDFHDALCMYLDRLKPDDRIIIQLFYIEENTIKEIGQITGYSTSNVKVKLHRSKRKLKEMMEANGYSLEKLIA